MIPRRRAAAAMRIQVRPETGCSTMMSGFRRSSVEDEVPVRRIPASADGDVTVSEVATYSFCAKAWHLEHALRRPVSTQTLERRALGTALHHEHGVETGKVRAAGTRLLVWSILLLGLAAVLLVLGLFATG